MTTDAQVLGLLSTLNNGGVKLLSAPKPTDESIAYAAIKRTLHNLSIEGAISVLAAFGHDRDTLHIGADKWQARDLAEENYFPAYQGRMASETPMFWFYGGPPSNQRWWEGTLQTLLEDRVLCEIEDEGVISIATLIGTDEACIKS